MNRRLRGYEWVLGDRWFVAQGDKGISEVCCCHGRMQQANLRETSRLRRVAMLVVTVCTVPVYTSVGTEAPRAATVRVCSVDMHKLLERLRNSDARVRRAAVKDIMADANPPFAVLEGIAGDANGWGGPEARDILDRHPTRRWLLARNRGIRYNRIGQPIRLCLEDVTLDREEIVLVGRLRTIQELQLAGAKWPAGALTEVRSLQSMVLLDVRRTNVNGDELAIIAGLPCLRRLELGMTGIDARALESLKQATLLTYLGLDSCNVGNDAVRLIRGDVRLTYLSLSRTRITDEGIEGLDDLRDLEELDLSDTRVGDRGMKAVARLSRLRSLRVEHTEVGDEGVERLMHVKTLRSLSLGGTRISDIGLRTVLGLPDLATLNVLSTKVSGRAFQGLEPRALRSLTLAGTSVGDRAAEDLGRWGELRYLDLSGTEITDRGLVYIAKLPKLQMLLLAHTSVADGGMRHLANLSDLRRLVLDRTRVTVAGTRDLVGLRRLEVVSLRDSFVTAGEVAAMRNAMASCHVMWSASSDPNGRGTKDLHSDREGN